MNTKTNRLTLIIAGISSVLLISCFEGREPASDKTSKAVVVRLGTPLQLSHDEIRASGHLEPLQNAMISTRLMGFITSIKVKPGDKVYKGQLLVTIGDADILARRSQAEALVSETEAALSNARKDYERFEQLFNSQSASAKEFENATLQLKSVQARADAAQQMKKEVEEMLTYTRLVAPFSGLITQKHAGEGSMANPGMPILTLEQSDAYQAVATITENEVGRLHKGMEAYVTLKSSGENVLGKVSEISPSSQFTGGQFQVKIAVPSGADKQLFSGMYVSIVIRARNENGDQSIFVPISAVVHKDQLHGIYTVSDDQTAQLRWLKIGTRLGDYIEVLSGLNPSEKFVSHSDGRLFSGASVQVK